MIKMIASLKIKFKIKMPKVHRNSGKVESYSGEKLREGIVRTCRAVLTPLAAAERFAEEVEKRVFESISEHATVTSRDVKRLAKNALSIYHPDAAEVYALEEAF